MIDGSFHTQAIFRIEDRVRIAEVLWTVEALGNKEADRTADSLLQRLLYLDFPLQLSFNTKGQGMYANEASFPAFLYLTLDNLILCAKSELFGPG